ncbi:MAG TPA: hypothetical protein EYP19_05455 [Desulfobacterales bacterium]|nr:hypothetical protein [Desulfobacterales bacterium]
MKSSTTPDFWNSYSSLPPEIKSRARRTYQLWKRNPRHPSLCFKKVGQVWSIRVGERFRALAMQEDDTFFWFWIGNHDEYKRLIREF